MAITCEYIPTTGVGTTLTLSEPMNLQLYFGNQGGHSATDTCWAAYKPVSGGTGMMQVNNSASGDSTSGLPLSALQITDDSNGNSNMLVLQAPTGTVFGGLSVILYVWATKAFNTGDMIRFVSSGLPSEMLINVYDTNNQSTRTQITTDQTYGLLMSNWSTQ
jgi:hypothetical protein